MDLLVESLASLPLLIALGVLSMAQTGHTTRFTGTWKLNLSKSEFRPGPPLRSFTLTFAPDGTRHLDMVGADGHPFKASLPWSDGKEVTPSGEGMGDVRVVSKIRRNVLEDTWKRDGALIEEVRGVVSPDGGTLTMNVSGPSPRGGAFANRVVFDRR